MDAVEEFLFFTAPLYIIQNNAIIYTNFGTFVQFHSLQQGYKAF